jgi:hypothetical protein
MKALIKAALLMAALAAIFAFSLPAVSTTPATIDVVDNDAIRWETVSASTGLNTTLGAVAVRTVVEFVDTFVQRAMSAPGPDLQARLQAVAARPLIGAAQDANFYTLAVPASGLSIVLANVAQRIEMHLADRSRDHALVFPGVLLQDKVPPEIGRPSTSGARVRWTTSEFSTTVVRYGPSKESLGKTTVDGELRRDHTVALDGMGPGITLFCQITNTDQSGNAATSAIYQVSGTQYVFMPSLSR